MEHDVVEPEGAKPYVNEATALFAEGLTDSEVARRVHVPKPTITRLRESWATRQLIEAAKAQNNRLTVLENNVGTIAEATRTMQDTLRQWEEPMNAVRAAIQRQHEAQGGGKPEPQPQGQQPRSMVPVDQGHRNPQDLEALKILTQAGAALMGRGGPDPMQGMMMQFFTTFMGAQTENIKSQANLNNILSQAMAKKLGVVAGEMVNAAFD